MTAPGGLLNHPKFSQMQSSGFKDHEQMTAALLVYLDLTEVKQWYSVIVVPCDQLEMISLTANKFENDHPLCILPVPTSHKLSMESISTFSKALSSQLPGGQLVLGLVDTDSTVSYYQASSGLTDPLTSHEMTHKKK